MQKTRLIILTLFFTAISTAAFAAERVDTIAVLRNVSSAVLTSDGKNSTEIVVEVKGNTKLHEYTYKYSSKVSDTDEPLIKGDSITLDLPFMRSDFRPGRSSFYTIWGKDVHVGAVVPISHDPGLRTGWELGVSKLIGIGFKPWSGGPALELGAGMVYRNLRLDDGLIFASDASGRLSIEAVPEGSVKSSSRLDLWAVEFPLSLRPELGGSFYIDLGVEMTLNFAARATRNYRNSTETVKYSQTLKHLHQRTIGMDLKFSMGWNDIFGVYVRYSPVSVFRSGFGPKTDFISAGASIVF